MDTLTRKAYELRKDILEMVYRSKAGHIGGDLSVIDILTVLYFDQMNVSPENFHDSNRDRFLLSKDTVQMHSSVFWVKKDSMTNKKQFIHSLNMNLNS